MPHVSHMKPKAIIYDCRFVFFWISKGTTWFSCDPKMTPHVTHMKPYCACRFGCFLNKEDSETIQIWCHKCLTCSQNETWMVPKCAELPQDGSKRRQQVPRWLQGGSNRLKIDPNEPKRFTGDPKGPQDSANRVLKRHPETPKWPKMAWRGAQMAPKIPHVGP